MPYKPDIDIKELIAAEEAAEELQLGPNGSLVFCIEYLEKNKEWLEEKILETSEDDLLLFDLPGQIELYVHLDAFRHIFTYLERQGVRLCVAYCLDITFFSDAAKSISGSLLALNAMLVFELPHVNILTKCDLVAKANIITKQAKRNKRGDAPGGPRGTAGGPTQRRASPATGPRASGAPQGRPEDSDEETEEEEETEDSDEEAGDRRGTQWAGRCLDTSAFGLQVADMEGEETEEDVIVEQLLAKDVQQIVEELDVRPLVRLSNKCICIYKYICVCTNNVLPFSHVGTEKKRER